MLAARMNVTRARIEALMGPSPAGPLYSQDGRSAGATDPRGGPRVVRA
jgi:hypothetical protein